MYPDKPEILANYLIKYEEDTMKQIRRFSIGVLLLVLVFTVSACGGNQTSDASADKTDSDTIKFAVVGPMTGDSAAWGLQEKKGVELAVEEINAAGGIDGKKLEFTVGDDQANPNQATILAQKLVSDKDLLFVLGHVNSGCTLSALPVYQKAGMPVITPTASNATLCDQGFTNFFRIIANDNTFTEQQVALAIKELGGKKPAILWENSDYGKGCHDTALEMLNELGVEVVGDESLVAGIDRDFSAQITKFKGAGVDTVLFMADYTAGALFAQQNISLGLNATIVGPGGTSSPKLIEIGGDAVEGFYTMCTYDPNDPRPKQSEFTAKYRSKYNEDPGEWCAHAYDVVYLAKEAYEAGGTTHETFIQKLHEIENFDGVTGTITFGENGDVKDKKVSVMVVQGGKFVSYIPTKY